MKTPHQIFKNNPGARQIPEVQLLINEYETVCDQLVNLQQLTEMNKEKYLKILVRELRESIAAELKRDDGAIRFKETERVDFRLAMENLQRYIEEWCRDHAIYL
ncbi:MAG: hypothetical protein ACPG7E_07915 [Marinirhabdus sp.]